MLIHLNLIAACARSSISIDSFAAEATKLLAFGWKSFVEARGKRREMRNMEIFMFFRDAIFGCRSAHFMEQDGEHFS